MRFTADTLAKCEDCEYLSDLVDTDLGGCLNTLCRPCAKRRIDQKPGLSCFTCKQEGEQRYWSCEACGQDFCFTHREHKCAAVTEQHEGHNK